MSIQLKISSLFPATPEGRRIAEKAVEILEHGPDGQTGRKGFREMNDKMMRMFTVEVEKLAKPTRDNRSSEGYMAAAVKSLLRAESEGTPADRAAMVERVFNHADAGYLDILSGRRRGYLRPLSPAGSALGWIPQKIFEISSYFRDETRLLWKDRTIERGIRDKFVPIVVALEKGEVEIDEAIRHIDYSIHPESKTYCKFVEETFGSYVDAFTYHLMMYGIEAAWVEKRPLVQFCWKEFNRDLTNPEIALDGDFDTNSGDGSFSKASLWMKNSVRDYSPEKIHVLDVNGLRAPITILSDMIYRMNLNGAWDVIGRLSGRFAQT